jgi:hypothetical protein
MVQPTISFLLHADVRATETGNCLSAMNVLKLGKRKLGRVNGT